MFNNGSIWSLAISTYKSFKVHYGYFKSTQSCNKEKSNFNTKCYIFNRKNNPNNNKTWRKITKNDAELIVTVRTHWTAMVRIVDGIDTTTKKAVHNGAVGLSWGRALAGLTWGGLEGPDRVDLTVVKAAWRCDKVLTTDRQKNCGCKTKAVYC